MENNLQKSTKLGIAADSSDAKYVSGLSTILVATIQEAKDRISQIEYIFCSQLFPNLQVTYQSLQKLYSEAREAAENGYKEKEEDLLLQVKNLQSQKQEVMEENEFLKSEKAKFNSTEYQTCNHFQELQQELKQKTMEINESREEHQKMQKLLESKSSLIYSYERTIENLEEKISVLLKMQKKLEVETEELQLELMKKSEEVDKAMELHNQLLQTNQSNASLLAQKEIQLKEYEEKTNGLISKLKDMEIKVNELLLGLRDKTEEVGKGKELQENLLKKIEFQASEILSNEQLLNQYEKQNRLLASKVENLVNRADVLQKELGKKSFEQHEERKVQEELLQQSDSFKFERIERGQALKEFEEERKQLLNKQKDLEEQVDMLQGSLCERTKEFSQQIEIKDSELQSEKSKKRDIIAAYKRLKSQYNYLLKKYALTQETMLPLPLDKMETESERNQPPVTSLYMENDISKASGLTSDVTRPVDEEEAPEEKKRVVSIQRSNPVPVSHSTSSIPIAPECASSMKSCPPAGAKRPISYWRDTRSHQSRLGPDPHDDFLDTPLQNVRENLGKVMKENLPDLAKSGKTNMSLHDSDDETQDMHADAGPQTLCISPPKVEISGFKYVQPVRKKSERESLKGVECKQCKKFYDAVLHAETNNSNNGKQNIRCEHHDGVSRHRYRYVPPSTPEGFWNIGFESET